MQLKKSDIDKWVKLNNAVDVAERNLQEHNQKIHTRIREVLDCIFSALDCTNSGRWYLSGDLDFTTYYSGEDEVCQNVVRYFLDPQVQLKTDDWNYSNEFPIEFLTMTNDKIMNIIKGQKNKEKHIRERALKKLTTEERKVLGL